MPTLSDGEWPIYRSERAARERDLPSSEAASRENPEATFKQSAKLSDERRSYVKINV
jgi:hypothetical protein